MFQSPPTRSGEILPMLPWNPSSIHHPPTSHVSHVTRRLCRSPARPSWHCPQQLASWRFIPRLVSGVSQNGRTILYHTVLTGVVTCYNLLSKWDEPPSREENVDKMVGESHKSLINSLVLGWIVAKFLHQQFSIHGFTQIQIHMYVWWIWINYDKLCHNPLPRTHSRN